MKIDFAIMSSDDNPVYLDFWQPVSKVWREKFNITPILLYFGNGNPSEEHGVVIRMGTNFENIPLASCWARYWFTSTLHDKVSIISDIDMIPMSEWYFKHQIEHYPEDSYIHLNPCIDTYTRLPSCYHVARGDVFKKVLGLHDTFEESYSDLLNSYFDNSTCYLKGGNDKWCYDEYYATDKILKGNYEKLFLIPRSGGQSGHRIDRTDWNYDERLFNAGYYYDSHSLRPYKEHKHLIDKLL